VILSKDEEQIEQFDVEVIYSRYRKKRVNIEINTSLQGYYTSSTFFQNYNIEKIFS